MASCKPQVHYFNGRGRAELIRLVMVAADIDFEDVRFTREEWPEKKKSAPTGVAPWVVTPKGILVQSGAIARFISKKHGLFGESEWEFYQAERTLGQIEDITGEIMSIHRSTEEKKTELFKEFSETRGVKLLEVLVKFIEEAGHGFYAGKSVTIADLASLVLMDHLVHLPELLAKFPQLEKHKKQVLAAKPKVADWLKNRPETLF